MNLPKKLTDNIQKKILTCNVEGAAELYSPVHDLTIKIREGGIISARGMSLSAEDFTDQVSPCFDETVRMYRQAFLKAPPLFSKINIELTRSCTLNCPHCFIEHSGAVETGNFNTCLIEKIMSHSPSEISLTGGEIFLTDNIKEVIEEIIRLSERRILFRILANGSWIYNIERVREFLNFTERTEADFQLRFTVFHHRPEIHDSICGSSGHLEAIAETVREIRSRQIPVYVNFPVTSFSFEERHNTVEYLAELTGGNFTVSSIIYPSNHALRAVSKFSLSQDQLSRLLSEETFRPLASAWCDPSDQCRYHCRFPLFDSQGQAFSCNLPGAVSLPGNGQSPNIPAHSEKEICSTCSASYWCKKCPSAIPRYSEIYCPLAITAAEKISCDYEQAIERGFISAAHSSAV